MNPNSCPKPQRNSGRHTARHTSLLTALALAAALALGTTPALSADITFNGHDPIPSRTTWWDSYMNWDGQHVPEGPANNALLGNYAVDLRPGSWFIRSFSGAGYLSIYGSLNIAAESSIGSLSVNGGTLTATGSALVTASRASYWSGGTMGSANNYLVTAFNDGLTFNGVSNHQLIEGQMSLAGHSAWYDNARITLNRVTLNNAGTFNDANTGNAYLISLHASDTFYNDGIYLKTGSGNSTIDAAFINNGSLAVNAGTLVLSRGVQYGSVSVANGAKLSLGANSSISTFNLTSGTLTGAGTLTAGNASTWVAGTMSGTGGTVFNAGLAISGSSTKTIDRRSVTLAGASSWSGNGLISFRDGAVLTNNGSFTDQNTSGASLSSSGAGYSFVNAGTYTKSGAGTTSIYTAFSNSGTLAVNAGTLKLIDGISGSGSASVASGTTLRIESASRSASSLGSLNLNGGALYNYVALSVSNASTWTGGTILGTKSGGTTILGSTTFSGGLAMSGTTKNLDSQSLILAGASSWSGNGNIAFSNGAVLTNNGGFADQNTGAASLTSGGAGNSFVNAGTYTKSGAGTTTINTAFSNSGTLAVNAGALIFNGVVSGNGSASVASGATLSFAAASGFGSLNLNGGTLTGAGVLSVSSASTWTGGTMSGTGISTFSGGLAINGATKSLDQRHLILAGASSWSGNRDIVFSNRAVLTNNGSFADQNTGGASLVSFGTGNSFVNAGTYTKSGAGTTTINTAFSNSGTLAVNAGRLHLGTGVSGSGNVSVASGAILSLGANSTVGSMAKAGTLALGANNLSVALDYNNASSGVGNAFNRHAGVTGTGQILALGNVHQTLSGGLITLGNTANAVLTLASVRVGDAPITTSFKINNVGSGASLRGAIQTGGISSVALSGSGVTAQNWGAVAAGGSTGAYTVTYSPTTAGQSLAGQTLAIVNNFDNVAGQTLSISGGKVYAPAVAQLSSGTLDFGIVHVGDTVAARAITVNNAAAPVAGFNDLLLATISSNISRFTATGSLTGLSAGAQDASSLQVSLDTSDAGLSKGSATLAFNSHNADMSNLALASQQVALKAQVNNYAQLGLAKAGGGGQLCG